MAKGCQVPIPRKTYLYVVSGTHPPKKFISYVPSSVQFVDAPVSGGINAAAAGTLTFMVFFML